MVEVKRYGRSEGKKVVVLHGVPVPPESVETITERLAEEYRVYVVDYCAVGLRPRETRQQIEVRLAEAGVTSAAVVGHSMGAYHAFGLAIGGELEVRAIAAVGSLAYLPQEVAAGYEELAQGIEAGVVDLVEVLKGQWFSTAYLEASAEVEGRLRRWFEAIGDEGLCRAARVECMGQDLRPRLAEIEAPVQLQVGALDEATPPAWSEEIADLLPRASLEVVEGVGHFPHMEAPEATLREIRSFLADH